MIIKVPLLQYLWTEHVDQVLSVFIYMMGKTLE